jgi:TonB family protein
MRKIILVFGFLLAALLPVSAEEFLLKDGTKIQGRMVAVKGDKIEVETAYGKMQIRRSDILSIDFPENGGTAVSQSSADPGKARPVDESLTGTEYVNRTGHFTLTVPMEWKINPELRASADTLAALSSRDNMRFLIVEHEAFAGSLESYKGLVEVGSRRNLSNFEKLSESNVTIDGRPGILLVFRGTNDRAQNLPLEFVLAIVPLDGEFMHAVAWCVEPLFNESERTLENILLSYRRVSNNPSATPPAPTLDSRRPSASNRVSVDSYDQFAKIVERVEPVYPALARQTRVQGTVRLHAIIGTDGRVEELEVVSGHPLLIQSALDAVRKWRYAPTMLNGQPVEVDTTIDVIFSLNEDHSPSISSPSFGGTLEPRGERI